MTKGYLMNALKNISKKSNKRAASSFVATILLIAFVIAIILMVILWGRTYILERAEKEGLLAEKQLDCGNLDITIVNAYQQGDNALIVIKNLKDSQINKFTFRLIGQETDIKESFEPLLGLEVKQYILELTEDEVKNLDKIDVIPWLKVAQGYFVPCSSNHIIANII
ncbi:hypothetical protein HYX17_01650 [Candidatus Woesearchaeota archaeon]|nr:hypothetical protein [Candidatus Woesearchaeota archaeon]